MVRCSRGWAAPEQLRDEVATPAVDVFAWGCLLAYLAGGVHPFASQSDEEWILRVESARPDLVGVPPGLHEVIGRTLARDPRARPSTRELATICRARGQAHRPAVPPPRLAGPVPVRCRRLPARLATGLARYVRALRGGLPHVAGVVPTRSAVRPGRRRRG
jgi:serine/threonine protein kinase